MKFRSLKKGDVFKFHATKEQVFILNDDGSFSVLVPSPIKHKELNPDRKIARFIQAKYPRQAGS